jgi:hypothetical protein
MKRFLLLSIFLTGCSTAPKPTEVVTRVDVIENNDKDLYIDQLESEISSAAGAVFVVAETLKDGPPKEVLKLTYTRLSGIKEPSNTEIQLYQKALKDEKVLQGEKIEASKVSEETTQAYAKVLKTDEENKSLKRQVELVEKQAQAEARRLATEHTIDSITNTCKIIGFGFLALCAGLVFMSRYQTATICGSIGMVCIIIPATLPSIIMTSWFSYTVIGCVLFVALICYWELKCHRKELDHAIATKHDDLNQD